MPTLTVKGTKRSLSSDLPSRSSKRIRKAPVLEPDDVLMIEDSDHEDPDDLKEILAQIKEQEDSERLAKQLETNYVPSSSGSKSMPIYIEDDAAMARQLAEEWALEDNTLEMNHEEISNLSDIEILPGPSNAKVERHAGNDFPNAGGSTSTSAKLADPQFYKLENVRPDAALEPFKQFFTTSRNCSKCSKDVKSRRGSVMFSDSVFPPSLTYLLHAPCSSCRTNHCRGCFKPVTCTPGCKGPSKSPKCTILTCCAEGRAIAIFETLGGFDRQFISERAASDSRALAKTKTTKTASKSVGPGGTGYGVGPGGNHHKQTTSGHGKERTKPTSWETAVVRALQLLVELLPAPYSDTAQVYDMLPHATIGHLLSLSQLPALLASLLRNDSVTDWIARKETYNVMLSLLRRMADCELTVRCLIGQQWEVSSTCGLENWMWDDGEITWTTDASGEVEVVPPLYTYFKKLTKQSEAFLAGAMGMFDQESEAEVDEMVIQGTSLCGDIIAARDDLERAITFLGQPSSDANREAQSHSAQNVQKKGGKGKGKHKGKGKGRDMEIQVDKAYEEACEKLSFKHVSLAEDASSIQNGSGLHYAGYSYAAQLNQTQNASRNPKNRLHLLKELAVTATSLPPGVWVRVDEVRNDAIAIMIAGPEGTPYAGGLFEFDCFIPMEYPNTPPLMHLRTTGCGSVRFNPNLYNCGKVCLSLLGTWPGRAEEQWSARSTLLQVLVSIQSMILIDAPYYNEPGHGQANVNSPVSISYNRNISMQTLKWAIVDWLQDKHRHGIWSDVIKSHFSILKAKIRRQIVEWSAIEPGIRSYSSTAQYYSYSHNAAQPKKGSSGVDLIEEFDKGMRVIESWNIGNDEA